MSNTLTEGCSHYGHDLGAHLIPDSHCPTPGATTYFFAAYYHPPSVGCLRCGGCAVREGQGWKCNCGWEASQ